MNPWEILLAMLSRARIWPIPQERRVRQQIALWAALRESDEPTIRRVMEWPSDRGLVIDPLPEKIATAYGDLLFSEPPDWTAADENDQDRIGDVVDPWGVELPAAEETCVSEGEVWWRISTAFGLPHPVLTWHSRADVVPLLHGRAVRACAFVSQLRTSGETGPDRTVWRHLEIHQRGLVANVLFRGRQDALGQQVALDRHPETAELPETWQHDLDTMLAGRIVNRWGRRPLAGVSIYSGIWTWLLELNEAATIGKENMRLTAKKRAVIPASALRPRKALPQGEERVDRGDGTMVPVKSTATFDAGEDLIVHDPLDVDESKGDGAGPFRVLEYSFDAAALVSWYQHLVETACQRCDIVPQFIGSGDFGAGNSGTALRVRLLPTTNAAKGRGRPWDETLPVIAQAAQLVDAMPVVLGGSGRDEWTNAGGAPSVKRPEPLPMDENEVALRHSTLKTSDLISIEQSLRERYPRWDDDKIASEVEKIRADVSASLAPVIGGSGDES